MAQAYSDLKQTRKAQREYDDLLRMNPHHKLALTAYERNRLELRPQLRSSYSYFEQNGWGSLADITRLIYGTSVRIPYRNEEEYLDLGYARASYNPPDDDTLYGNIWSARLQNQPLERLLLFGQINFEDFPNRFADRLTYDAGFKLDVTDYARFGFDFFRENIVENGETLRQDIHREGIKLGTDFKPHRRWDLGASYLWAEYSDNNPLNELNLYNAFRLTLPPKLLKLTLNYNFKNFSKQTVFNPNPRNLRGIRIPYFSPDDYSTYSATIEWKHYLGKEFFKGADQCWYDLQYTASLDSDSEYYNTWRAELNWDIRNWLTLNAQGMLTRSGVYDAESIAAYLIIRFR